VLFVNLLFIDFVLGSWI